MEQNKINDNWRLCDEYSVVDAAFLIIGFDPSSCRDKSPYHNGFEPILLALKSAIARGDLAAKVISDDLSRKIVVGGLFPGEQAIIKMSEPDWNASTISANDLKKWLASKGQKSEFFFSQDDRNILDCNGQFYAPKLAAAIKAWEAVTKNPSLTKGKSAKDAMKKWLKDNAQELGLIKTDGIINAEAVEQAATVANWQLTGGAPRTE